MYSNKLYVLVSAEDGNPLYNMMFNSLFTLRDYLIKYDGSACGVEYEFNSEGIAKETANVYTVNYKNELKICDRVPWD